MRNLICIIFTGFLCCINCSYSQSTKDTTWIIETKDGNNYVGTIIYLQDSIVQINASVGVLNIHKKNIRSIIPLKQSEIVKGEFWPENPHSSRYFWGPSGYNLRKGEGYYQNTWIMLNQVSYGITKNISLGLGIIPLFLFGGGAESTPLWITPKN